MAAGAANGKVEDGFKGVTAFLIGDFIVLALLAIFPIISTYLPPLMD